MCTRREKISKDKTQQEYLAAPSSTILEDSAFVLTSDPIYMLVVCWFFVTQVIYVITFTLRIHKLLTITI